MARSNRSVTFTIVMLAGILIALAGTVATIAGLAGSTVLKITVSNNFTLETTSSGLALVVIGAALTGFTIKNLPENTRVFAGPDRGRGIKKYQLPIFAVGAIALIGVVFSVLVQK